MRDIDETFQRLGKSKFRRRFRLGDKERHYIEQKGIDTIIEHAHQFIQQRLADAQPRNDGKQTPMRGHPVFIAQHATATCCRGCLAKWHGIEKDFALTEEQIEYIAAVIRRWLETRLSDANIEKTSFIRE
jgi:hypothetical protein